MQSFSVFPAVYGVNKVSSFAYKRYACKLSLDVFAFAYKLYAPYAAYDEITKKNRAVQPRSRAIAKNGITELLNLRAA